MNWNMPRAKLTAALKKFGVKATITSASTGKNESVHAIYAKAKKTSETVDTYAQISGLTIGTELAYINVTKTAPLPGDTFIGKLRSYIIRDVEPYKPADEVIAYKLTLE